MLTKIKFEKFTVFESLEIPFSRGINILVGENGTGKTHILKAAYAACDITEDVSFAEKINNVFYPSRKQIGRLVKRASTSNSGFVELSRFIDEKKIRLKLGLSNHTLKPEKASISGSPKAWAANPFKAAYIPVKDMMANAPGFLSLYKAKEIYFEEIYADIIFKAFSPILKGPTDIQRKKLLERLQDAMDGKVILKGEEFYLRNKQGELEFTLLAEGFRKLGLLLLLIQNGTLLNGSTLFWDEPETNLNPKLMRAIIGILLELQRMGVQIFLATHDYIVLKEFDIQAQDGDDIMYHSLYRGDESGEIEVYSTKIFNDISPNAIDDVFGSLIDREIEKSMGRIGK